MWRVMRGYHRSIKISFMLVGHTKFSPDSCFGLLKKRFCVTKVSCLDDLVNVVNTSADVNEAQLVGSQSGQSIVSMYDWVGFFGSHVKKVPQITQQHHFHFSAEAPGTVVIQNSVTLILPSTLSPVILHWLTSSQRSLYHKVSLYSGVVPSRQDPRVLSRSCKGYCVSEAFFSSAKCHSSSYIS